MAWQYAALRYATLCYAQAGLKNPRGPLTMKRFDGASGAPVGHGAYENSNSNPRPNRIRRFSPRAHTGVASSEHLP